MFLYMRHKVTVLIYIQISLNNIVGDVLRESSKMLITNNMAAIMLVIAPITH
jgi:hypothetical protein